MKYEIESLTIGNFRKLIDIKDVKVGSKLNVISGHNGVGKSSLLSLLASGSGTNEKRLNNGSFQPEFNDYFKIDPEEGYEDYNIHLKYKTSSGKFTKRISFKDDRKENRGIRPIPRTHVWPGEEGLIKDAKAVAKNKFSVGDSARVPIPTLYVSLSRIFPLGETEIETKELAKHNKIIQQKCNIKFREWYNQVLPNSITDDSEEMVTMKKQTSRRSDFYMKIKDTSPITQSVGQDNLRNIITALVDFYALSLEDEYNGGILFIDEIDTSLHPSAQINLFYLLKSIADELELQIFVTSHSLTIIDEIIRLSNEDYNSFQLIYLKGTRIPTVATYNDYRILKADLFQETNSYNPEIKIYCEDVATNKIFELLIETARSLKIKFNIPNYNIIPVHLGANHLIKLPKIDKHFTSVLIVLDGDARSKTKISLSEYLEYPEKTNGFNDITVSNNIVFNPGYLSPEGFLYSIIYDYVTNDTNHLKFWRTLEKNPETTNMTSDKIEEEILLKTDDLDKIKTKSEKIFDFVKKSRILEDYYDIDDNHNNYIELVEYINKLEIKFNEVLNTVQSRRF